MGGRSPPLGFPRCGAIFFVHFASRPAPAPAPTSRQPQPACTDFANLYGLRYRKVGVKRAGAGVRSGQGQAGRWGTGERKRELPTAVKAMDNS